MRRHAADRVSRKTEGALIRLPRKPYYCPKHGKQHMVLQEMEPGSFYHSEVWCKFRIGDKLCNHRKSLTEKQVNYFVRTYPNAEMHSYGYLKQIRTFNGSNWQEWYGSDHYEE